MAIHFFLSKSLYLSLLCLIYNDKPQYIRRVNIQQIINMMRY